MTYAIIEVSQLPTGEWCAVLLPSEMLRLAPRTASTPQMAVSRLLSAWTDAEAAAAERAR